MVSRVARSRSASRSSSPKSSHPFITKSTGPVLQRVCRCFQSSTEAPQKLQSSGVREATSNQWWQTRRKLNEPLHNPANSLYGMMFRLKTFPSISGGRVETFNREFRVRLSWIMVFPWPPCSSICFSNARMESIFFSRSIAVRRISSGVVGFLEVSLTYSDGDVTSQSAGGCWWWWMRESGERVDYHVTSTLSTTESYLALYLEESIGQYSTRPPAVWRHVRRSWRRKI